MIKIYYYQKHFSILLQKLHRYFHIHHELNVWYSSLDLVILSPVYPFTMLVIILRPQNYSHQIFNLLFSILCQCNRLRPSILFISSSFTNKRSWIIWGIPSEIKIFLWFAKTNNVFTMSFIKNSIANCWINWLGLDIGKLTKLPHGVLLVTIILNIHNQSLECMQPEPVNVIQLFTSFYMAIIW